jgi:DNA-binding transcriptional LysR family regulator
MASSNSSVPALTLHQLRIVWTVAHAQTVSRAAKQLGLSQPSLSQQIAKLEASIGQRVFERGSGRMVLTDIGSFLVEHAEQVLRDMQALEDGLADFGSGARTIGIAGISSPLRVLLPRALSLLAERLPGVKVDVHESSPSDALALLFARRVNVSLVAASSLAQASMGFLQVPLLDDPYVLVAPEGVDLTDPAGIPGGLPGNVIHFVYGTHHQKRIEDWYDHVLPGHRVVARCRSFEVAVSMVRAGLGICLAPSLSCLAGNRLLGGIRLYDAALGLPRPLVALIPSQYRQLQPYSALIECLEEAGRAQQHPTIDPAPDWLARRVPD